MAVDAARLDQLARGYAAAMTSIRGRRVHRLVVRAFATYDHVVAATAEDGSPALLALADDGRVAVCRTDGRGPTAVIAAWARLDGATVTTAYDLLRDSLPVVRWEVWHPAFARGAGALTIGPADADEG
ncbi:MAG: hypothetical protein ABMB14_02895, partial [Myxococcota bacterium]